MSVKTEYRDSESQSNTNWKSIGELTKRIVVEAEKKAGGK